MQKAKIKLFLKGKMRPLFVCEVVDKVEDTVKTLRNDLNNKDLETVMFGQVCFKRSDFKYFEIIYK